METIGERIRQVRKSLKMNLDDFGAGIGVTGPAISLMENGRASVTDRTIKGICREFHISEAWLRTGEGQMHIPKERREEIETMVRSVLEAEPESFKAAFISALPDLTVEDWAALERMFRLVAAGLSMPPQEVPADPPNVHDWTPDEMAAEARRQAEAEEADRKGGGGESSACGPGNCGAA